MLTFLKVKDFAIIDEVRIEFEEGLNVITGETGAGKSIIINALSTLMNAKVFPETVRTNMPQAEVSGHFFCGSDEYVVKRIISQSGRSRAFLNDNPVTMGKLEETGKRLVNIYGQNEFQHLLNKENYVAIVDNLLSLTQERENLAEKVRALKGIRTEIEKKKKDNEGREKEMYLLEFQCDEIERTALINGEEDKLREKLKILKDAEKIRGALEAVSGRLVDDEQSIHTACRSLAGLLKPFRSHETIEKLKDRIESLAFDVEDIMTEVKSIGKYINFDPEELEALEARLSRIFELKNKYGKSYDEIMAFAGLARERLAELSTIGEDLSELQSKQSLLEKDVHELATFLSEKRITGARSIEHAIVDELGYLSMRGTRFRIDVTNKATIDEDGSDDIELLIGTNPGEPLKPLRKIASGGELSRIMLAIKRVIGGEEGKTLIFDEVDAGIGGRVAELVGKRLKKLAKDHQIICITHLPQIAMYGDRHFLVEKQSEKDGAKTDIRPLTREERISEIARMIGGVTITEKTVQRAEEMLHNAEKSVD